MAAVAEHAGPRITAEPAPLGARLIAFLLDWLVTFILVCLFTASAGLVLLIASDMGREDPPDRALYAALLIASLVVPVWAVLTLTGWVWHGRSAGKLAMNLQVVDSSGRPPGIPRAAARLVVYMLENAPIAMVAPVVLGMTLLRAHAVVPQALAALAAALVLPVISAALALRDPRHRTLHDLAAGTLVVAQ